MIERRISEGMTHWPRLATEAGLAVEGWTPELLNSRNDPEANRIVLRLTHPSAGSVVLKQGLGKGGAASVSGAIEPQRRAERLLERQAFAKVPKVLAAHPEGGAFLMETAAGQRLEDLVDQDSLLPALERAGAWLDAFHRSARTEERAFQPRFMLTHLTRLAEEAMAGKRPIPRRTAFAEALIPLTRLADEAKDARTVSSLRHGDLNARNLLIDKTRTWGFDFGEAGSGPVGYDIARLLVHLTEISARPAGPDLVQKPMLKAFFSGYTLTKRRDGSLPFLYFARLMADWASLGASEDELSLLKVMRLERIVALAKAAATAEA